MNAETKVVSFLRALFFPPKCCSCGEFLQKHILDIEPRALCETCRQKWELAKLSTCPKCKDELSKCRCMPFVLQKAGVSELLKLVSYHKNRESVAKRCVLSMKRKNVKEIFSYFSEQLAHLLADYLEETYTKSDSVLVTYVPRGLKNARKTGMDQSELLASGVSATSGCDFESLLGRKKPFAKEQKKLGGAERFDNVRGAFYADASRLRVLNGQYRCLVLVDDVVTTGASLAECAKLLREGFHGRIICLCLAQSEKS